MSGGVTYEGALQSSGGAATMFQGKRFWVAHRVPIRSTLVRDITSNGGRLVPLEKNADYLIADHLKPQAAPANSFSWQWIEDSAKAGRLLDANAYLIHKPSAAPSQPPTERQGTRVGRTPFTDEDDKLLIAFVQKARKEDRHIRGLEVYKELEKKNPRHTFHSWRDRWVKKLQFLDGVSDGISAFPSPASDADQLEPASQPRQAEQSVAPNPNLATNPLRPSAAAESARPSFAPKSSQPSTSVASKGPGPRATAAAPRPSVVPALSRSNVSPGHVKSSPVVESSRPGGTPEYAEPSAAVEPPRPSTVPTPPQPIVRPEHVPSGVTPQPPQPSAAPEFAWPSSVVPQPTPINTSMRTPELSSTLKRKSIFTEEEDHLLTEYVHQMWEERGKDADASLDIFAVFELDFPQHSARVWRHRWIRYLRPPLFHSGDQGAEEGPNVTDTPLASNAIQQPQVDSVGLSSPVPLAKPTTPETRCLKGKEVVEIPVSDPAQPRSVAPDSTPEGSDPAGQKQYRDDMSEPSLGADPGSICGEESVPLDNNPPDFMMDPGHMDEEEFVPHDSNSPNLVMDQMARQKTTNHAFAELPGNPRSERQLFASEYERFWYANGPRRERFNPWPTIRGRTFDLFDLWKAATSQHAPPAERDWEVIAENLDFDWVTLDGVQHDLAEYFEEHLGEFEEVMVNFENDEESIEEDENFATPQAETPEKQSETSVFDEAQSGPLRQPFNSSPPKLSALKRTQAAASLAYPEVGHKRRKFDRSVEISSTPDHKSGTAHLRRLSVSAAVSPSDRRFSTLPRSSRSTKVIRQVMSSSSLHDTRGAVAEPETQDFHYDPDTQNIVIYSQPSAADRQKSQSSADVTASQQLTLESEGFVEVSSSARKSKKPRGAAHISPLRRQVAKDPFLDSPDDEPLAPIPKPRFGKGRNPLLPALAPAATKKRRSLPWPQDGGVGPDPRPAEQPAPGPAATTARPRFIRPPRSDEPSSPAAPRTRTPGAQADSPGGDAAPVPASCNPLEIQYLRRVLRDWERRGYARDVALGGLDATTWTTDISDEVIELLQRGEPVPDDWHGVWTEADDRRLAIVDGREPDPPKLGPERCAHRRERALRRLLRKFDDNCLKDRRHWLSIRHALQEADMEL